MQITIDTSLPLSPEDREALALLIGVDTKRTTVTEPAEKPASAPAKRPASKPAAKPAPEPEPEDDDLLGDDSETVTAESVFEKAAALVSKGKGAAVKAALKEVDAPKVREVTADKLVQFNDLLDAI